MLNAQMGDHESQWHLGEEMKRNHCTYVACGGSGGSQNATSGKITIDMAMWVNSL